MPRRYGIDFRCVHIHPTSKAHRILVIGVQYAMLDAIGQRLDIFRLDAICAQPNGTIGTDGKLTLWALWLKDLHEILHLSALNRRAFDLQHPALHLSLFAWKTDQAFDIIGARHRM